MSRAFLNNSYYKESAAALPTYLWGGRAGEECLVDNFSDYFEKRAKEGYWTYTGVSDDLPFFDKGKYDQVWEFEHVYDFRNDNFYRHVYFLAHEKDQPKENTVMFLLDEEIEVSSIDYFTECSSPVEVSDPAMIEFLNVKRTVGLLEKIACGEDLYEPS